MLPETLLLYKMFCSFFALHTIVWAAWVVSHYRSLFFFFSSQKRRHFRGLSLSPVHFSDRGSIGTHVAERKKCSWKPWDVGLHLLLWKLGYNYRCPALRCSQQSSWERKRFVNRQHLWNSVLSIIQDLHQLCLQVMAKRQNLQRAQMLRKKEERKAIC